MANFFYGTIQAFGCNYAPEDWALCNGQSLNIQQNPALYSLIGTAFGGNGQSTFNLPNLMGRVAIGAGQGAGLHNYIQGAAVGAEKTTMSSSTLAVHNHTVTGGGGSLMVSDQLGATATPSATANTLGVVNDGNGTNYNGYIGATPNTPINTGGGAPVTGSTTVAGSTTPTAFSILQPVQAFTYAICTYGIYPDFE
jgi:microcystin-dependent protein